MRLNLKDDTSRCYFGNGKYQGSLADPECKLANTQHAFAGYTFRYTHERRGQMETKK